ncbi:oxidoreductase [Rhizobium ruizarguesonis]|uniref:oxidoreductase n=1 Tax=Rhizobium ruizarguesonis TaxID=2081791 RepID=UPI00247873A6|nr:hypothetical protein [Rhizobium ruizarguesonis]
MSSPNHPLLAPIRLGDLDLPNRIVMASMTRARTDNPGFVPNELQARFYAQRASTLLRPPHAVHFGTKEAPRLRGLELLERG